MGFNLLVHTVTSSQAYGGPWPSTDFPLALTNDSVFDNSEFFSYQEKKKI